MRRHIYQDKLWHILTKDVYKYTKPDNTQCIQFAAHPIQCTYQPTNTRTEKDLKKTGWI